KESGRINCSELSLKGVLVSRMMLMGTVARRFTFSTTLVHCQKGQRAEDEENFSLYSDGSDDINKPPLASLTRTVSPTRSLATDSGHRHLSDEQKEGRDVWGRGLPGLDRVRIESGDCRSSPRTWSREFEPQCGQHFAVF